MEEDLTANAQREGHDGLRIAVGRGYQTVLGVLAVVLLLSRSDPTQFDTYGWLVFGVLLLISIICEESSFSIGPGVTVSLGGLFGSAAVLTLGFNGLWVHVLADLYWQLRSEWREPSADPPVARLASGLFNIGMSILPPWLGLFAYADLLGGDIPLSSLQGNLVPALAYVLVQWVVLLVGVFVLVVIAERGLAGAVRWLRGILTGAALTIYAPILFSPVVAVILNSLGLGFFLFVAVGLLGISYMAWRLAQSLAAEQRRVRELTALNALSSDIIHSSPTVETTAELFSQHILKLVAGADLQVCLFEEEQPGTGLVVADWRAGQARSVHREPLTPIWAWLRDEHRILHAPDIASTSLPVPWSDQDSSERPGSLLLIPLLASDPEDSESERCIGGLRLSHSQAGTLGDGLLHSTTALANQLAAALENARLQQEALARERLERELALARSIQTSFLPEDVPGLDGWTLVASSEPARQVSGDFYDFIPLPGSRWGVVIADVADKGMPAALYMALARTLIRAHAPDHPDDPAACLLAANDQILTDTRSDLFVTVFYGILDPTTGEMVYSSAGHDPPYHWDGQGHCSVLLRTEGMALGVVTGVSLENRRVTLERGDLVVLYTDGYSEAHDKEFRRFGPERIEAVLTSSVAQSAKEIHRGIQGAIAEFVGDAPQSDDRTLVVLGREGPGS